MTIRISRNSARGLSRRRFLSTAAATGAGALGTLAMPHLSRAADRPQITHGVQSGDVGADGGVVWARADRPSQMMVEVATTESFNNARLLPPIAALPGERASSTAKMPPENLPGGQEIFYRVRLRDLRIPMSPASRWSAASAPRRRTGATSICWGGGCRGQGWGINPDEACMVTFTTMARNRRTSCCIPATPSMPTASFHPR